MDEKGFRGFVREGKGVPKGLSESTIRSHIRMVKEFERYLAKRGEKRLFADADGRDVKGFIRYLKKEDRASFENLIGLLRYSRFSKNDDAVVALFEFLNTGQLSSLYKSFGEEYGKKMRAEILGRFEPPPLGTSPKRMPKATSEFLTRLESGIGEEATRKFLMSYCPDTGPPEYYSDERALFLASKDLDDYLRRRRRKFLEELQGHMKNGTLFYNQKIDRDVIDYVRGDPEVGVGVRRGGLIFHTKIPYMAIEYLREKSPTMKRYHYCHCPLARESILTGKTMSQNLCYCSAGYTKRPFEAAFDKPLRAEVRKSVLWGDSVCQFAIEIPEELIRGGRQAEKAQAR
jgi:hypothetical protein